MAGSNGSASVNGNGSERQESRVEVPLKPIPWVPKPPPPDRLDEARARARRTRRVLFALAGVIATGAIVTSVGLPRTSSDIPTISDEDFVRRADEVCRSAQARVDALPSIDDDAGRRQRAAAVDRYVAELEVMVADLRDERVADADRAAVRSWLADWAAFDVSARRLAEALRSGDDRAVREATEENRRLSRAVNGFAITNGMGDCVFTGG